MEKSEIDLEEELEYLERQILEMNMRAADIRMELATDGEKEG